MDKKVRWTTVVLLMLSCVSTTHWLEQEPIIYDFLDKLIPFTACIWVGVLWHKFACYLFSKEELSKLLSQFKLTAVATSNDDADAVSDET